RTSFEHDVIAEPVVLLPRVASAESLGESVLKTRDGRVVIADALARKALDGTLQHKHARERIRSAPHPWRAKELKRFNPSVDQLAAKLLRRRVERAQAFDGTFKVVHRFEVRNAGEFKNGGGAHPRECIALPVFVSPHDLVVHLVMHLAPQDP